MGKGSQGLHFSPFVAIYRLEKEHKVSHRRVSEIKKGAVEVDTLRIKVETCKSLEFWTLYGKGRRSFDESRKAKERRARMRRKERVRSRRGTRKNISDQESTVMAYSQKVKD